MLSLKPGFEALEEHRLGIGTASQENVIPCERNNAGRIFEIGK